MDIPGDDSPHPPPRQLGRSNPNDISLTYSCLDMFMTTRAAGPHVGTDPVSVRLHDPTGMLLVVFCLPPTPTRDTDCITHIGFIKSHMPSVLRTEGVILSDRHGGLSLHAGLQPELDWDWILGCRSVI